MAEEGAIEYDDFYTGEINLVDFTNIGLSSNVQNKVEKVLWNIGENNLPEYFYSNDIYDYERGNTTVGFDSKWVGKVGLMYASDYYYAADATGTTNTKKLRLLPCVTSVLYTKSGF